MEKGKIALLDTVGQLPVNDSGAEVCCLLFTMIAVIPSLQIWGGHVEIPPNLADEILNPEEVS